MRRSERKRNTRLAAAAAGRVLAALLLLLLPVCSAFATEEYHAEEKGSLQVEVKAAAEEDGKEDEPVMGVELNAVPVAEFNLLETGEYNYVLNDLFAGAGINVREFSNTMTASRSNQIAETLDKFVKANREKFHGSTKTAVTGSKGTADFGTLAYHGIYLVYQSGAGTAASAYTTISPFLVQVPLFTEEDGWVYAVKTIPKTVEKVKKPDNPPKPPKKSTTGGKKGRVKTGDESNYRLWAGLFFGSAVLLLLIGAFKKRDAAKEG